MTRRFSLALAAVLAGCVSTSEKTKSSVAFQPSPTPSARHATVTTTYVNTPKELHRRIVTYDPPKYIGASGWLTREIFFSDIPGYPKVVFRVPCVRMNEVDPPHTSTEQCTAAEFTYGALKGMIITADGQIFAPPGF